MILQRYLLVWLTALSLVAYYWPPRIADPFVATKSYLDWLVAVTMLAIGTLLTKDEIQQVIRRWPTVFAGTAVQYTAMPLLAYSAARLFHLDGDLMMGVVLVGCVPGAMASNVLTLAARGNVSYSVSLTTSATLLSPIMVPLALYFTLGGLSQTALAGNEKIWGLLSGISLKLLLTIVLPVIAGYLLRLQFAGYARTMESCGRYIANGAILWIIAVVVGLNRDRLGESIGPILGALATVNLLGYAAGFSAATGLKLAEPMRRALTLEVGMQNAGVGTMLAMEFFSTAQKTAIPTAAYTFGCMLTGTILAQYWSLRVPHDGLESGAD